MTLVYVCVGFQFSIGVRPGRGLAVLRNYCRYAMAGYLGDDTGAKSAVDLQQTLQVETNVGQQLSLCPACRSMLVHGNNGEANQPCAATDEMKTRTDTGP